MCGENKCACGAAPKLIFACSGSADVGAIADQTARKLAKDGHGKMFCLAGIGRRVSGIIESTKVASKILAKRSIPKSVEVLSSDSSDCAGFPVSGCSVFWSFVGMESAPNDGWCLAIYTYNGRPE